jgi:hypothetical protein
MREERMIFTCGDSWGKHCKEFHAKREKLEKWHIYFAWYPVLIDDNYRGKQRYAWLENVWRKGHYDWSFHKHNLWAPDWMCYFGEWEYTIGSVNLDY